MLNRGSMEATGVPEGIQHTAQTGSRTTGKLAQRVQLAFPWSRAGTEVTSSLTWTRDARGLGWMLSETGSRSSPCYTTRKSGTEEPGQIK